MPVSILYYQWLIGKVYPRMLQEIHCKILSSLKMYTRTFFPYFCKTLISLSQRVNKISFIVNHNLRFIH